MLVSTFGDFNFISKTIEVIMRLHKYVLKWVKNPCLDIKNCENKKQQKNKNKKRHACTVVMPTQSYRGKQQRRQNWGQFTVPTGKIEIEGRKREKTG